MLDAVRMCGRWISKTILERITQRTMEPDPPTRKEAVESFCRSTHWCNGKGELCVSSARVCLNRLEEHGWVRLPPPSHRAPRCAKRKLLDDGKPLPALPKLPPSVEQIPDLQVRWVADDQEHRIWNRLISRLHPLKGAPLVGRQLRYLIWAGTEVAGALGFGPASFYLSCRDSWIGWDTQAQEQNR